MNIVNVRLGLANNSSSSHSLIIMRQGEFADDHESYGQRFGWDNFTLASRQSKLEYLGIAIKEELQRHMHQEYAAKIASSLVGVEIEREGYVDHDSRMTIPIKKLDGTIVVHEEYIQDILRWIANDRIVIAGGNDNDEDGFIPVGGQYEDRFSFPMTETLDVAARKNSNGNWVLFNRRSGAKVKLNFNNLDLRADDAKSDLPELIDWKITNRCSFGCEFCYADSTTGGDDMDDYARTVIEYALSGILPFEVALGGGEPTQSKHFAWICKKLYDMGIVVNFTTRTTPYNWNDEIKETVKRYCSSVAFSVNSYSQALNVISACDSNSLQPTSMWSESTPRFALQIPMGTVREYEFERIIELAKLHSTIVTLLGYKNVGRGNSFRKIPYDNWIDILQKCDYRFVNIDTVMAAEYAGMLDEISNKVFFRVNEGESSMFIDGVEKFIAPSSFCDPSLRVPMEMQWNKFQQQLSTQFKEW